MWVFFLLFLHHSSLITLASRLVAVRFGLLVIDEPPLSAPSITSLSYWAAMLQGGHQVAHQGRARRLAAVIDEPPRRPLLSS